jgi:hypothetical protein
VGVDGIHLEVSFAGSPDSHGAALAAWLRSAHEALLAPTVEAMNRTFGPPGEVQPHEFFRRGEWYVTLATSTLGSTDTFLRYTGANVEKALAKLAAGRLSDVDLAVHDEIEGVPPHRSTLSGDFRSLAVPDLPNHASSWLHWPHLTAAFDTGAAVSRVLVATVREAVGLLSPASAFVATIREPTTIEEWRRQPKVDEYDLWEHVDRWIRAADWLVLLRPGQIRELGGLERALEAPCEAVETLEGPGGPSILLQATRTIDAFTDDVQDRLSDFLAPVLPPPPEPPTPATPEEKAAILRKLFGEADAGPPRPWETEATRWSEPKRFAVHRLHPIRDPDLSIALSFGAPLDADAIGRLDDAIDRWYREWSEPPCPTPLHSMSELDFDDEEASATPIGNVHVDFGSALPGALHDLLGRLDHLAVDGLPLTTVTLGARLVD